MAVKEKAHTLSVLKASLEGEVYDDEMMRGIYATDASVYRELPYAVAVPKTHTDIKQLVHFASSADLSLIPRAAGTSLAGQCVGSGIVVDVSQYLNQVLEVNPEESWVRVQPGVVRDELNQHLKPYGLFFGPNTSTANRAMIGGMVGNNSCGSYSIVYGTTRDHVMELHVILSDGSEVVFGSLTEEEFQAKLKLETLEGQIYRQIYDELSQADQVEEIQKHFPKPEIHRRNTGYAVDELLHLKPFSKDGESFNFCKLITGSEGTLALITEIKLHVDPTPPPVLGLLCVHFDSIHESLKAVPLIMEHQPRAVELMDKIVLDCTRNNRMYSKQRFFINGDPAAILIIEFGGEHKDAVLKKLYTLEEHLKAEKLGYDYPQVFGTDIKNVWNVRKAGLGLLANVEGEAKPVAVIEDTAVTVQDLPEYIQEFSNMMTNYGQQAVYYAHAGAGELHLRPILNLKDKDDVVLFRSIAKSTAELVKKYDGSLSGEHGDGRVRAEFIPLMIGDKNYQLLRRIKQTWDPKSIFNPGKIVDAPPMDHALRYEPGQETKSYNTIFDFSSTGGILRAAEQCNGSADCRKTHLAGGTMCPSYMATRNEKDTTRARANLLREFLTHSEQENPFSHKELYEVMDLCLSCKGCTSECPSNVDMATLKAEFLHHYYETHGVPFRAKAMANIGKVNQLASKVAGVSNFFLTNPLTSAIAKKTLGVALKRSLPPVAKLPLRKWYNKYYQNWASQHLLDKGQVYFFCDEFTNFNDAEIGIKAVKLLTVLGYEVLMPTHADSGRAHLSKGLIRTARANAMYNTDVYRWVVSEDTPLVGVEPSAILSFRDEYPRLVIPEYKEAAQKLGKHVFMIEEFLAREIENGKLDSSRFSQEPQKILLHGHCHQKALASVQASADVLSLPQNYEVEVIPSGCCGMAGSFGYEAEHYDISMKIGELVLFPKVREKAQATMVAAPGTSCRHQIFDGTGEHARHPVEILWEALLVKD